MESFKSVEVVKKAIKRKEEEMVEHKREINHLRKKIVDLKTEIDLLKKREKELSSTKFDSSANPKKEFGPRRLTVLHSFKTGSQNTARQKENGKGDEKKQQNEQQEQKDEEEIEFEEKKKEDSDGTGDEDDSSLRKLMYSCYVGTEEKTQTTKHFESDDSGYLISEITPLLSPEFSRQGDEKEEGQLPIGYIDQKQVRDLERIPKSIRREKRRKKKGSPRSFAATSPRETRSFPSISPPSPTPNIFQSPYPSSFDSATSSKTTSPTTAISPRLSESYSLPSDYSPKKRKLGKGRSILDSDPNETSEKQWNLRFQKCLEKIYQANEMPELILDANVELMHLNVDFIHVCRTVGKIIVSEVFVPNEKKTFQPLSVGGIAGGQKYFVHNILFKFAVDSSDLFNGCHWAATKVANHELTGLMSYFSLSLPNLYFPLMALVDYRGFRLVAMSVLPTTIDSLIYGTQDGGRTIVKKKKEFNAIMEQTMKDLNLKPHVCGCTKKRTKRLCSAADIEGHLGRDNKYYLLDFSRTMPPFRPDPRFPNGHLYQLFRRELVVNYPVPLCSDAYSGFIKYDKNRLEHNEEINRASDHLLEIVIPAFAESFAKRVQNSSDLGGIDVVALLHRDGINLRYLGLVIACYRSSGKGSTSISEAAKFLLLEATSRVIKNEINKLLRKKMYELRVNVEVPYRRVVIQFLNCIFGVEKESGVWWQETLPHLLNVFFSFDWFPFSSESKNLRKELFSTNFETGRQFLYKKIVNLIGLKFSKEAHKKILFENRPLELLDVIEMGERVKDMEIISSAQASFFFYKSLQEVDTNVEIELLERAIEKYDQALRSMPTNRNTRLKCSKAIFRLLDLKAEEFEWKDNFGVYFPDQKSDVRKLEEFFQLILKGNENDFESLCLYALFLDRCRSDTSAEEYYLRSLEANPEYLFAVVHYGNFLFLRGHPKSVYDPFFDHPGFLTQEAFSPLTLKEMGQMTNIYLEDGSFQTLFLTCSMNVFQITSFLLSKISFSEKDEGLDYCLFQVELKLDLAHIILPEEISANIRSLRSSENRLPLSDNYRPYLTLQRPKNRKVLCFWRNLEQKNRSKMKGSWAQSLKSRLAKKDSLRFPLKEQEQEMSTKFEISMDESNFDPLELCCGKCGVVQGLSLSCTRCQNVFCRPCAMAPAIKNPCFHGGPHEISSAAQECSRCGAQTEEAGASCRKCSELFCKSCQIITASKNPCFRGGPHLFEVDQNDSPDFETSSPQETRSGPFHCPPQIAQSPPFQFLHQNTPNSPLHLPQADSHPQIPQGTLMDLSQLFKSAPQPQSPPLPQSPPISADSPSQTKRSSPNFSQNIPPPLPFLPPTTREEMVLNICSRCGDQSLLWTCWTCEERFCYRCVDAKVSKNPCVVGGKHLFGFD